ncbi:MAG: TSUP family transporter [bacterium]
MDLFWLVLLGAGFGAGAVSAATGIGWGILIVPLLLLLKSDIPPKQVVAIALLSFLFNGAMASFQNVRHGLVVWD